ncbi:MAG: CPBP family intramembrane metalloprotease [Thermostichus sp. DG_1_6_bins_120]
MLVRLGSHPFPLRLLIFLGLLALAWLPFVGIGWWLFRDYLWLPLYGLLLGWIWLWGKGRGSVGFATYGLDRSWACRRGILQGLGIGCGGLLLLFAVEGWLRWLTWQLVDWESLLGYSLLGLLLGLAVGLVEELFFRGWMLQEMALDYGMAAAAWGSSLIFAMAHFLKPLPEILTTWPQFPGLVFMGLLLVQARRWTDNKLGLSLGLHAGWVWGITWVNNLNWIDYTGRAPEWVTGIGGNPLAGVMGILFLGITFAVLDIAFQRSCSSV